MRRLNLERKRNLCFFFIAALLVFNVLDAASTGYLVLSYGIDVEQIYLSKLIISNFGLMTYQLTKIVIITFVAFYLWFHIEKEQNNFILSVATVFFFGLYVFYGVIVFWNWNQIF